MAVNCDEIKVGPVARMGGEEKCMKIFGTLSWHKGATCI